MEFRVPKKTYKFGIKEKVIAKEMKNVNIDFQLSEKGEKPLLGSTWIPCHMVFNIKFDVTCKAKWVAGGHRNNPPKHLL
eukprot:2063239-Ditylum_brightwellii.AAC.1